MENNFLKQIEEHYNKTPDGAEVADRWISWTLFNYCKELEKRLQVLEDKNLVYGICFTENMRNGK